jgi:VanZ family protein
LTRLLWLIFAAYWVALAIGTRMPKEAIPDLATPGLDKPVHLIAFAGWAALGAWATSRSWPARRWAAWMVLPVGLLYGAVDEWTQPWWGRTCDYDDWRSDAVGVFLGFAVVLVAGALARRS